MSVGSNEITLGWQLPDTSADVPRCEVRYYEQTNDTLVNSSGQQQLSSAYIDVLQTIKDELTVSGLKTRTEYALQVRCLTQSGWTDFSRPIFQATGVQWPPPSAPQATSYASGSSVKPEQSLVAGQQPPAGAQVRIIAGVSVAAVVALLVAVVMILVYLRR